MQAWCRHYAKVIRTNGPNHRSFLCSYPCKYKPLGVYAPAYLYIFPVRDPWRNHANGILQKDKRTNSTFINTVRGNTEIQLNNAMEAPLGPQRDYTDYSARRCSHSTLLTPLDAYPKLKVLYYICHLSCRVFLMLLTTAFMDAWKGRGKHIQKYFYKHVNASVHRYNCG
jgi:hypothetical protein